MPDDPMLSLPDDDELTPPEAKADRGPFWRRLFERPQKPRPFASVEDEAFPVVPPVGDDLDDSYYSPPSDDDLPGTAHAPTAEDSRSDDAAEAETPDDADRADAAKGDETAEPFESKVEAGEDPDHVDVPVADETAEPFAGEVEPEAYEPPVDEPAEAEPEAAREPVAATQFVLVAAPEDELSEEAAGEPFVLTPLVAEPATALLAPQPVESEGALQAAPHLIGPEEQSDADLATAMPDAFTEAPAEEPQEWAEPAKPEIETTGFAPYFTGAALDEAEPDTPPAVPYLGEGHAVAEPPFATVPDREHPSLQETQEFPVVLPFGEPATESATETAVFPAAVEERPQTIFDLPAREVETRTSRISPLFAVVRVLALPRSTFDRVLEEAVIAWPAVLAIVLLSAVTKTGVAIGFAARGGVPATALAGVTLRYGLAVAAPLMLAAAAAAWILLTQRLWRGEGRFGTILSAASLAIVPLALRNLLQAGFMAATHEVLVHPGLSAIVAPPASDTVGRLLYGLLGGIDLFALWAFVLLVVATRVTRGRGWLRPTLMILLFGLLVLAVSAGIGLLAAPLLTF